MTEQTQTNGVRQAVLDEDIHSDIELPSIPTVANLAIREDEWRGLRDRARVAVKSGLTKWTNEDKALHIIATGRELGLGPMTSLRLMHLVDGKVGLEAQLMHSLVMRRVPGARIDFIERSEKRCIVEVQKPGHQPARFDFTIEEAESAGLTRKANWKYKKAMLSNRARSAACREYFPEACAGVYDPDELDGVIYDPMEAAREVDALRADLESMMPICPVDPEVREAVLIEARGTTDIARLRFLVERAQTRINEQNIIIEAKEVKEAAVQSPTEETVEEVYSNVT